MFIDHTSNIHFSLFEFQYKNTIVSQWGDYIAPIHCYTYEQYSQLEEMPELGYSDKDTFSFVAKTLDTYKPNTNFYAIVYSPTNCEKLQISDSEHFAAIGHEVGHIINYLNPSVPNSGWYCELKADELDCCLGLTKPLIDLLERLIRSDFLEEEQAKVIRLRIKCLQRYLNF